MAAQAARVLREKRKRERWQRQQSLEVEEGVVVVEAANMRSKELATIRKLGLTLPVLPIQASC